MTQWELCVVETSLKEPVTSFEDYVAFHFFGPDGYEKLSTGEFLFDRQWEGLDTRQKRLHMNRLGMFDIAYQEAICRLLEEGWEPIGSGLSAQGAPNYTLRRVYEEEPDEL